MMAIIQLEDLDSSIEVMVWPDTFRSYGALLDNDATLLIGGEVSRKGEIPSFIAHEIYPLQDAPKHFCEQMSVHISCTQLETSLLRVKDILRLHPGTIPVVICLIFPEGEKVMITADKAFDVDPDGDLIRELEHELGEKTTFVKTKKAPLKNGDANLGRRKWEKRK